MRNHDPNPVLSVIDRRLHLAVNKGNLNDLERLLDQGVNPDSLLQDGTTPLHLASQGGNKGMVELLLNYEANPELKTKNGSTALILASQFGHSEVVDALLEKHPNLINQVVIDDFNPLIIAAQEGHLQVVKILLDRGVDPKLTTAHGSSALHLASQRGNLKVVKTLVKKDPNLVNKKTTSGLTCLDLAVHNQHFEVVDFFNKFKRDLDARSSQGEKTRKPSQELRKISSDAWKLCKEGRFKELKSLIEGDRSILFDHKFSKATMAAGGGSSEKTLFHLLAENGSDEAIEILSENSVPAHFNQKCTIKYRFKQEIAGEVEGVTPLYHAVQKGRKAMVEFLITKSDLDCVVTKKPEGGSEKKYSLLEGALKEANLNGDDSFEILKMITGVNDFGKKASFYSSKLTKDEKQNQKERIARKFQSYRQEVKALLKEKYPIEIAEIEKMSQGENPAVSPRVQASGGPQALSDDSQKVSFSFDV